MSNSRAKRLVRSTLGLPVISDALRWFLRRERVPAGFRSLVHRKLAKAALFGSRTFKYRTDGTVLELTHTATPNYLYWLGEYEPETLGVFTQLARSAKVIFDVGAADGLYSIFAAAANPAARIHAFEPFAQSANIATRNLRLNPSVCRNVALHRIALGAEDGVAVLYVASGSGGNSSLNPEFRAVHSEQSTSVCRGDSFMSAEGIERVDLMKIDTESTEPNVLRGLRICLERHHPDIVCEVLAGRTEPQLMEVLAPLGYRYWSITSNGLERREQIVGDVRFLNYLFTTADEQSLVARGLSIGR